MTFEQQADKVSIWTWKKGLHKVSSPLIQHNKMVEEVEELRIEIFKGDVKAIEDELGDVLFTACVQAELWGLDPTVCLAKAVAKVTGRKGKMVDGLYVKDPQ